MAFYELEPFGDVIADLRHGVASALLANVNRDREARPEPYSASEFIHWGEQTKPAEDAEPTLIADPVAQSDLIRAAMFGIAPKQQENQ